MRILLIILVVIFFLALLIYFLGKSNFIVGERTLTFEEKIVVLHHPEGSYTINFATPGNYKIYQGISPTSIDWTKKVAEIANNKQTVIDNKEQSARLFFGIIDTLQQDTAIVSERLIPMQGTNNFRDIGGIPTTDGRYTKWGMIYRSGRLEELTDADIDRFRALGIQQVFDFRNDIEIGKSPDRLPDDYQGEYTQLPIVDKEGKAYKEMKRRVFFGERRAETKELFTTVMSKFADSSVLDFKPLFDKLLVTDKPLLYHCTGGKDRTGYATAIILSILGVDKETIISEYLMSNYYKYEKALASMKKLRYAGLDKETTAALFLVQQEYIEKVFDIIENDFGGMDNYLEVKFGIDEAKRNLFKEKYTYPAAVYLPEEEELSNWT
jgi:protein-tyrosine phosphatase